MSRLKDFANVKENLRKYKKISITALHKFVNENEGDRSNRERLQNFIGFDYTPEDEHYRQKSDYVNKELTEADLTSICLILNLNYDVRDKKLHIFNNLIQGNLLNNGGQRKEDDDEEDDDEEQNDEEDDQEEDEGAQDANSKVSNNDYLSVDGLSIAENRQQAKQAPERRNHSRDAPRLTMAFRDLEETMSKFDGSINLSIRAWLEEFEEMASIMSWDNFQKYVIAKKLLTGLASLFIRSKRGNEKMMMNVLVNSIQCRALFDTGSKLNLLSETIFTILDIKSEPTHVRLFGFGNKDPHNSVKSQGAIKCKINIDQDTFHIQFQIVPKKFMEVDCVVGEEFCRQKVVKIDEDGVHFKDMATTIEDEPTNAEYEQENNSKDQEIHILSIDSECEFEAGMECMATKEVKAEVLNMITNYSPIKTKFTNIKRKSHWLIRRQYTLGRTDYL